MSRVILKLTINHKVLNSGQTNACLTSQDEQLYIAILTDSLALTGVHLGGGGGTGGRAPPFLTISRPPLELK